jgi:hypothetical protein
MSAAALSASLVAGTSLAGSYMDRVALLVTSSNRDSDYLRGRLGDKELARVIHAVAQARVDSAGSMQVPKEVVQAHPHLLLVLENHERAADAAVAGNAQKFLIYQQRARDEERVLRGVLKQLGFPLPDK